MKKLILALCLCASVANLRAADAAPKITVDLYGNVFQDGQNTNSQIGDFARNHPELAPQVDGAIRELVIAARAKIASDTKAAQDAAAATAKQAQDAATAATEAAQKASADVIAANASELAAAKKAASDAAAELAATKAELETTKAALAAEKAKATAPAPDAKP